MRAVELEGLNLLAWQLYFKARSPVADLLFKLEPFEFDDDISTELFWRVQVIDSEISEIEAEKAKEATDNVTDGARN